MTANFRGLKLLPPTSLVQTSEVDHADWNYRPLLGAVQRARFRLVLSLLGQARCDTILEIGYGSGVFMPELAARSRRLIGVDPHPRNREVTAALANVGIEAELHSCSAESLPVANASCDAIVAVSALEYVPDADVAAREICRVLRPGGVLVFVTPSHSPIWDLALRLSTGESPSQYGDRRQRLVPTLLEHMQVATERGFPRFLGRNLRLYTGYRLAPRATR